MSEDFDLPTVPSADSSLPGDPEEGYLILKNGETTIGLFHGMFEGNILTFNPGLTNRMERLETFTDVHDIQQTLDSLEVAIKDRVDPESNDGPASITLVDPDGNSTVERVIFVSFNDENHGLYVAKLGDS